MRPGDDLYSKMLAAGPKAEGRILPVIFGLLILVGAAAFVAGLMGSQPERAWEAYLVNFVFWTGLACGSVLFSAVLTITNAILATALLSLDLFSRETPPKDLSKTIGLMNLTSVPFGGIPMCRGAGGYAAQYRFGARTGGANIIAGAIFVVFALFFASPEILTLIAIGFFGALLVFVALELARHGLKTDSYIVTLIIAVLALVTGMTIAFLAGLAVAYLLPWFGKHRGRQPAQDL